MVIVMMVGAFTLMGACEPESKPEPGKVATPVAYPPAGEYSSVQNVILFSGTDGAAIYYTTDGNTPTTSSARYTDPIVVSEDAIIKAIAMHSGIKNSNILTAAYIITSPLMTEKAALPVADPPGGTYSGAQFVTLTSETEEAEIYYTVDGSTPSASSNLYTGTIAISDTTANTTIRAIATRYDMADSDVRTVIYTILKPDMGPLTEVRWLEILQGIEADSTFNGTLDLSNYSRSDTVIATTAAGGGGGGLRYDGIFDPRSDVSIGKSKIVSLILPGTTTGIASGTTNSPALRHFTNLQTFNGTLLSTIGDYAFAGCTKLAITGLPTWLTSIGAGAFQDCPGLTQITLPENLTSIGAGAFQDCISLTKVSLPAEMLTAKITSIGASAFRGCTSLTEITLPAEITSIGSNAFQDCTSLTQITLPTGLTSIGDSAFLNSNLTRITIPQWVDFIDSYAFSGCANLTSVTFMRTLDTGDFSFPASAFPGNLRTAYFSEDGGMGKYTRNRDSDTWTWTNITPVTITYNMNGGIGAAPTAQTVAPESSVTIASGNGFERSGFTFSGWNTGSSGNGTHYYAGEYFVPARDTTLYAQWEFAGVTLTENTWTDDALLSYNDERWFRFTATASTQYIHINFGTLTGLSIQLYDSDFDTSGNSSSLYSSTTYTSRSVTDGDVYYIKVTYSSYSGTYQIGFNTTSTWGIPLTANTWTNGAISSSNGEQWFSFTATAYMQYIHVSFGTLTDLNIQLYDSNYTAVGSTRNLYYGSAGRYISQSVTSGNVYYIKVTPYGSYSGTYQIAFNTSETWGTLLTANTWSSGNIVSSNGEQWFQFTATAYTQYIHVSFGTLTDLNIQLYDSNFTTSESSSNLYSSTTYTSRSVTSGNVYYIKVTPYGSYSGTYQIAFNTVTSAPQ